MTDALLQQPPPVLFIGGKGGVGKTSVASALALHYATNGYRTLLVSTDPAHSLSDAFAMPIGAGGTRINERLYALELDPDSQVEAHIAEVLASMKQLSKPAMYPQIERQLKLTAQSPGTQEAALLEAIAKLIDTREQQGYDVLIFDTAPTGHTLRLLILPEAMAAWTQGMLKTTDKARQLKGVVDHLSTDRRVAPGHPLAEPQQHDVTALADRNAQIATRLRQRQQLFQRVRHELKNPKRCAIALVLTPEKLPILETQRAVQQLQEQRLPLAALWINRNLPATADGDFLAQRRQQEAVYQQQIRTSFKGIAAAFLPLFATDLVGLQGLQHLQQEITATPLEKL
ncbi:ArsA family ATPase [Pseudidiomarina insulisalsae]|uniref:arsenite-transporting ATPase n=1 Tax=Pseudidiomarina insulisalsae TaxID=575789 RepID=A0A432YH05_9GAMM|nr:ArsA family ATPase [Pseudidiomarina insulisalsae]RUO60242.1 arsenic-transporting ATPase [Pseudidiomarina insulisalsae]